MVLLLASFGLVGFGAGSTVFFLFPGVGAPIASLWIFWLIGREPPAQRVSGKSVRLACILLTLAPPVAMSFLAASTIATETSELGMFLAVFFILPWAVIQIVPGAIAFLRVAFQKLAPPEVASTSSPTS